jgi:hypothetical protein
MDDGNAPDMICSLPVSTAWITDELLQDTRRVWSKAYGRVVSPEEAVEILMNVRRLAEVLWSARGETNERRYLG